jgi:hypothetical protein
MKFNATQYRRFSLNLRSLILRLPLRLVLILALLISLSPLFTPSHALAHSPKQSTPTLEGIVCDGCGGLRLRESPSYTGKILRFLPSQTRLSVQARTADSRWLSVRTNERHEGWVVAQYVTVKGDLNRVRVYSPPILAQDQFSIRVSPKMRDVFVRGQQLGNRADVFSKVGDSLTVATFVMYPIGWGRFNLRSHTEKLFRVAEFFRKTAARSENSFANISLAADNGWTTRDVLNPGKSDKSVCQPNETPLACEYRVVKPSVALILIGTNDVRTLSENDYRQNMERIISSTLSAGIIPILSTLPPRAYFEKESDAFNQILFDLATRYEIPISDYGGAMKRLPNKGLSVDGVHPSSVEGDYPLSSDFSERNLNFGYTLRNWMILRSLDDVWRQAMY